MPDMGGERDGGIGAVGVMLSRVRVGEVSVVGPGDGCQHIGNGGV